MDRHWGGATLETYVTIRLATACLLTAVLVSGCTTSTVSVKSGTTTPVSAMALYTQHACTSWEPPQARVIGQPANGTTSVFLTKGDFKDPKHPCFGKTIDRRMVSYTSRAGFRGQDRLTVQYDYINNDGGGRASRTEEVVIDVQ
jgi:hypothetical protein